MEEDRRARIQALENAMRVLELFGSRVPDLRIAEVAERAGMNRSGAQRILHTLIRCGYLKRDPASMAISLSHRCALLANTYLKASHLIDMAMVQLVALNARTRMCSDLWVASGSDAINIARIPANTSTAALAPLGQRLGLANSAPGHALAAASAGDDVIIDIGKAMPGEACMSAPVFGADGETIAAVSVSSPLSAFPGGDDAVAARADVGAAVAETARTLSAMQIQIWARTFTRAERALAGAPDIVIPDNDGLFIGSIAKGLRTLEAFSAAPGALTLTDLHRITGYPISTLQRLVDTLTGCGYVDKDPRHKALRLSVRALDLLRNLQIGNRVLKSAWPRLVALRDRSGLRCSFCILDGTDIVHLQHVQSQPQHDFRTAYVGAWLPALSSSGGLAMLSRLPERQLDTLLSGHQVKPMTPFTITDTGTLRSEIRRARERGYAFTEQQSILGDVNAAAAIVDNDGQPIGAIVVSAPCSEWTTQRLEAEIVPALLHATRPLF